MFSPDVTQMNEQDSSTYLKLAQFPMCGSAYLGHFNSKCWKISQVYSWKHILSNSAKKLHCFIFFSHDLLRTTTFFALLAIVGSLLHQTMWFPHANSFDPFSYYDDLKWKQTSRYLALNVNTAILLTAGNVMFYKCCVCIVQMESRYWEPEMPSSPSWV